MKASELPAWIVELKKIIAEVKAEANREKSSLSEGEDFQEVILL